MTVPEDRQDLLAPLRTNWFIIAFIGSMIFTLGMYAFKFAYLEKEVEVIKSGQAVGISNYNTLSLQMARIETELVTLNKQLARTNPQ